MPKKSPAGTAPKVPTYLRHRAGGRDRAFCYLCNADGTRRQVYLGRWNSAASKRRFREIVGGYLLNGASPRCAPSPDERLVTIAEIAARFLAQKEREVVHSEWERLRYSAKPLLDLYRDEPAATFGPKKLRRVRDEMVASGRLSRREINRRVTKIRAVFCWATSEELIPASVYEALRTLPPLRRGQTAAHEPPPVLPAPPRDIVKALRFMPPTVATMVRLQLKCGARPGEIVAMKRKDISRSGPADTWIYAPQSHKNAWREQTRRIALGRRCQQLLEPFMKGEPDGFVFSPRRSEEERRFLRRRARKTPLTPSQRARDQHRRDNPKRTLADRWTTEIYRHAVHHACRAAGVPPWSPGQLRHNFEVAVERRFGVEAAAKALGHADVGTTQHYRDRRDLRVAIDVATAIG